MLEKFYIFRGIYGKKKGRRKIYFQFQVDVGLRFFFPFFLFFSEEQYKYALDEYVDGEDD